MPSGGGEPSAAVTGPVPPTAARSERPPALEVDGLGVTYGSADAGTEVLRGLDIAVEAGEFLCVVGPSGVGKTTLIQCVAGLLAPSAGRVRRGLADPAERHRRHQGHRPRGAAHQPGLPAVTRGGAVAGAPARRPAQIGAGARTSLGISVVLMVGSELYASSSGIGYFVLQSQQSYRVAAMWSGVILLGIIGYALNVLYGLLERRLLRWQPDSQGV